MILWPRASFALAFLIPLCLGCQTASTPSTVIDSPAAPSPVAPAAQKGNSTVSSGNYTKPSRAELKQKLTPIQFEVTQNDATEPPFRNEFYDNHAPGLYVDVATGEPLFSSSDKFESGTGWPSFTRPVEDGRVVSKSDGSLGMVRTEVRSAVGGSHLGHVFDDGPAPTGLRYCINSASLRFVPLDRLKEEGYGAYLSRVASGQGVPLPSSTANACAAPKPGEAPGCEATLETAVLKGGAKAAAGLRGVAGVLDVAPDGRDGVRVTFDPKQVAYVDLMARWRELGGSEGDQ